MAERRLPVRPNLDQLKHQAKDLLHAVRQGDSVATAEFQKHHPKNIEPGAAKLADAQLALARSYGLPSWQRLTLACRLIDAIWRDDVDAVRELVLKYPRLMREMARGTASCNWGPPMSYAANLGRDRIIAMLRDLGAEDAQFAFDRACLQGQLDTARLLYAMGARPALDSVMGPAETQNDAGMAFFLELGAEISDANGNRLAPVAMVLETYGRNPKGKHQCLELFAQHGADTPRSSVVWWRNLSACGITTTSPGCCWIMGPIRTSARRCGNSCGSSGTSWSANTTTSLRWRGASGFTNRIS